MYGHYGIHIFHTFNIIKCVRKYDDEHSQYDDVGNEENEIILFQYIKRFYGLTNHTCVYKDADEYTHEIR